MFITVWSHGRLKWKWKKQSKATKGKEPLNLRKAHERYLQGMRKLIIRKIFGFETSKDINKRDNENKAPFQTDLMLHYAKKHVMSSLVLSNL